MFAWPSSAQSSKRLLASCHQTEKRPYCSLAKMRLHPLVKLNDHMLNTSIGSCRRTRRRKICRNVCLKFCALVFIILSGKRIDQLTQRDHGTLAGFFIPTGGGAHPPFFEGRTNTGSTATEL